MNYINPSLTVKKLTPFDRRMFFEPSKYDNNPIAIRTSPTVITLFSEFR